MLAWHRARALAAADLAYRDGWDYAAGELLRGTPALDLFIRADTATDHFDRGLCAALLAWEDVKGQGLPPM